ncbi:MAG: hypothetical protein ACJAZ1_003745, partial [Yoonia sp.]
PAICPVSPRKSLPPVTAAEWPCCSEVAFASTPLPCVPVNIPCHRSYPAHLRNRGKKERRTTTLTQGDWREVVGQHAPLAPGRRDVEDCIEHVAQTRRAWPTSCLVRRHQGFNQRPFRISQITCGHLYFWLFLRGPSVWTIMTRVSRPSSDGLLCRI